MNIVPSDLNRRLAGALTYSVASERFYIAGKVGFWRLVGLGLIALGLGTTVGIGFVGYSYIRRNSDNFETLTAAFSKALANVQFQATAKGIIQLEPKEIHLAKGQIVSLEKESRVLIDPKSRILADGELRVQVPSVSVGQSASTSNQQSSKIPVITNFTIFKTVIFGKGSVQTGWNFYASTQRSPSNQYCYYTEELTTPGDDFSIDIGLDRKPIKPATLPKDFDLDEAFAKCVWFRNEAL